jgi:hypothetical protein
MIGKYPTAQLVLNFFLEQPATLRLIAMRTIKLAIMIGSAAYLLSSTGPSLAQSADIDADLRCLVVAGMALNTGNNDSNTKKGLEYLIMFFLGNLNGRDPNLSIISRLDIVAKRMTLGEMEREAVRCSKVMEAASKRLEQERLEQGNPLKR